MWPYLTCSITFWPNWLLSDRLLVFFLFLFSSSILLIVILPCILFCAHPFHSSSFGVCTTHAWNRAPGQTSVALCPWSDLWLEASGSRRVAVTSPNTVGDNLRALLLSLVSVFLIKIHTATCSRAHIRVLSYAEHLSFGVAVSHLFLIKCF